MRKNVIDSFSPELLIFNKDSVKRKPHKEGKFSREKTNSIRFHMRITAKTLQGNRRNKA
jgi:hypothetical protein